MCRIQFSWRTEFDMREHIFLLLACGRTQGSIPGQGSPKSLKQVVTAPLKRSLINSCECHGFSEMTIIKGSNHNQTKFIELYKNICYIE